MRSADGRHELGADGRRRSRHSRSCRRSPSRDRESVIVLEEPAARSSPTDNAPWWAQRIGRVQRLDPQRVGRVVQAVIDAGRGAAPVRAGAAAREGPASPRPARGCSQRSAVAESSTSASSSSGCSSSATRIRWATRTLKGDGGGRPTELRDGRRWRWSPRSWAGSDRGVQQAVSRAAARSGRGPMPVQPEGGTPIWARTGRLGMRISGARTAASLPRRRSTSSASSS